MDLQILQTFKTPIYALGALFITAFFGLTLLYFDEFIFFTPYFVMYVAFEQLHNLLLDIALSILTGFVIAISIRQIRLMPSKTNRQAKTGLIGIFAALVAGACPCYYLVPLLAVAGGAGGVLATIGIQFNAYKLPVKVASLGLLVFVSYSLERNLRSVCNINEGM